MRQPYPSDIGREQFETIREALENAKKKTKPREVDLYEVFCAILYVLKSGCQWRMMPRDFPKWQVVYKYFWQWGQKPSETEPSLLERALKKCGWQGPYQEWTERMHIVRDSGCPEREEYGYGRAKRL
jgi:transposase